MPGLSLRFVARATAVTLVLLATGACVSAGPPENKFQAGSQVGDYALNAAQEIVLELPVGAVEIIPGQANRLLVKMEIACDPDRGSCFKLADNVTLQETRENKQLLIKTSKSSRFAYRNAEVTYQIEAPDGVPLVLLFGYGEINIRDLQSNLRIVMSAGDVNVRVPEHSVRNIWLDANVGDASLLGPGGGEGQRRLLVGAEVDWREGKGTHDISIDLGAGDITVKLTN